MALFRFANNALIIWCLAYLIPNKSETNIKPVKRINGSAVPNSGTPTAVDVLVGAQVVFVYVSAVVGVPTIVSTLVVVSVKVSPEEIVTVSVAVIVIVSVT